MDFNTKYGTVKLTAATSTEVPDGIVDLDIRQNLNTVEVTDDPANTYGLATKWFVVSSVAQHADSPDAHKELFDKFLEKLYNLYDDNGELKFNAMSDADRNVIYANGKVVRRGDGDNPLFVVCSRNRETDYDALEARVKALEDRLLGCS